MKLSKSKLREIIRDNPKLTYAELATLLNSQGYVTSRGNGWTSGAIGAQAIRWGFAKRKYTSPPPPPTGAIIASDDALLDAMIKYKEARDLLVQLIKPQG